MDVKINLPFPAKKALQLLNQSGYEAYVVGGCVRDSIMGKKPQDWDITTSALPQQTMDVFKSYRIIETGLKHGTVTAMIDGMPLEITTYRIDGEYRDNRRPETVTYTSEVKEDLRRRDFTVNAMAYNPETGLLDCFGGIEDLQAKCIRCVGSPDERFNEDGLRIMRAMRFASVLGFTIAESTSSSIHSNSGLLKNISAERISAELNKMLTGVNAASIIDEYRHTIAVVIPELKPMFGFAQHSPHHHLDVWKHTVEAVKASDENTAVRLAMLLHDIAKPETFTQDDSGGHFYGHAQKGADLAERILRRLKYDNCTVETVRTLVFYHDSELVANGRLIKRWLNRIGENMFRLLLKVREADIKAQAPVNAGSRLQTLNDTKAALDDILESSECFCLKDMAVNGRDVMLAGVPAGKCVGEALNLLMELVIDGQLPNDKKILMEYVSKYSSHDEHSENEKTK